MQDISNISNLMVILIGLGTVFAGLICIIIICSVMGAICKNIIKEEPKVITAPTVKKATIVNKGEFAAAVAAAVAEEVGTDVSGIRILSIKPL